MVEEPHEEEQQHNGSDDGCQQAVELGDAVLVLAGAGFELAILTGVGHQVDVDVAVLIAAQLVVNGRVGHTELFADGGHEVRSLVYG